MYGLLYRKGNAALNLHIFHTRWNNYNSVSGNNWSIRCTNLGSNDSIVGHHGQLFRREWRCQNEDKDDDKAATTTAPAHWHWYRRHEPTEAMLVSVIFLATLTSLIDYPLSFSFSSLPFAPLDELSPLSADIKSSFLRTPS